MKQRNDETVPNLPSTNSARCMALLMLHSPGGDFLSVSVDVGESVLTIAPRVLGRLVALANGARGSTSIRRGEVERIVNTSTATNGGIWICVSDGTQLRLSLADHLLGPIAASFGCEAEVPSDRRVAEREERALMLAGGRFDW